MLQLSILQKKLVPTYHQRNLRRKKIRESVRRRLQQKNLRGLSRNVEDQEGKSEKCEEKKIRIWSSYGRRRKKQREKRKRKNS